MEPPVTMTHARMLYVWTWVEHFLLQPVDARRQAAYGRALTVAARQLLI